MTPPLCPGTRPRRAFLQSSLVGLWGVTLADMLRTEAAAAASGGRPTGKSIIVLWLWGGPSHMETFDLKPDAPSEFRGDFNPIPTNVSGIRISEHLPKLAKLADRYSLLRSLHHDSPGHVNSTHSVLTGYKGEEPEAAPFKPKFPDVWSVINREKGDWASGVPPYLNLGGPRYNGGAYLGNYLDPLVIAGDPNAAGFKVPDLTLDTKDAPRVERRAGLRSRFDALRRELDTCVDVGTLDAFQQKALSVLTSQAARKAFDLSAEPDRTRDLYGRHVIGQRCLLARRLVEAGARIVTIDFPCVPGQKAFSWDDHASVWNIFEQMKIRLPVLDQVCSAVIQDLKDKGLDQDVLFVAMGEMGRTPRLSNYHGTPGREHWSRAMSVLMSGGGMRMGQVIGETNPLGEEPAERPITPGDLLATWYRYFGVPLNTHYEDKTGRPIPLLERGEPIRELV